MDKALTNDKYDFITLIHRATLKNSRTVTEREFSKRKEAINEGKVKGCR